MTVSHTYFSFSSWVEVGNVVPTIVISAMYKDSMKCVVSRGGLRLFQKLFKMKLLRKLISIWEQQRPSRQNLPTLYFSMKLLLHYARVVVPVIDFDISVSDRVILEPHQVEM